MRERVAIGLTAVWVCGAIIFMAAQCEQFAKMDPNEWGDFFAGVFSPIALLWLVLGYFQQGRELRLQVEELKKSVEQQKELAQATKSEVEISRTIQQQQVQKEEREAQPKFVVSQGSVTGSPPAIVWFKLTNRGAHIDNLAIGSGSGQCTPHYVPTMEQGGNFNVQVAIRPGLHEEIPIAIDYYDSLGVLRRQEFELVQKDDGSYTSTPPGQVAVKDA